MVRRQTIQFIRSLSVKKYRDEAQCFVAEGPKVVGDLLPLMRCRGLYATADYLADCDPQLLARAEAVETVKAAELERISQLRQPHEVVAVFEKPAAAVQPEELARLPEDALCLFLDTVQDPGNVGTIVRIADWFGIRHVFATPATADVFSPKVVQATMGALARVSVHYVEPFALFGQMSAETPVYGTFLEGESIYGARLDPHGLVVMGNEGNGISEAVSRRVTRRLFIPPCSDGSHVAESLNVAVATAIVCSEFRRNGNV